jgi:protein involved in polysaccharide export with SLBB domain
MSPGEFDQLKTRLTSRRADYRVDWSLVQKSPELDPILITGDMVVVDVQSATVRVDGEVVRPGLIQYNSKLTARDYVERAGGYSERAETGKVLVTRRVTGQTIRANDVDHVAPGDMIWVPERPEVTMWEHFLQLVMVGAQVATIVIVFRR